MINKSHLYSGTFLHQIKAQLRRYSPNMAGDLPAASFQFSVSCFGCAD
jgi:hypothetical protein